ncbi:MAG: S8 family serine peptidase, partial [Alphaproteobacteria bacterium]|nr:S8 family serine peptidase [Alphaproteobacteria bacterium]
VIAFYPASYDLEHVVSIADTDHNDLRAGFSNFSAGTVELAGPGVNIHSTLNHGGYGFMSGTSMATPHVAGAAAVLLAAEPELTPHELKHRLMQGTDFKNLPVITGGRLNLFRSLVLPASPVTVAIAAVGATQISPGDAIEIDYTVDNNSAQNQAVTASLRAWSPAGDEQFLLGPVTLDLAPGEVFSGTFNRTTPLGLGSGNYRVIGRVGTIGGTVFDEDRIDYEVD